MITKVKGKGRQFV